MQSFVTLGKKIYDTSNPREARRMTVFVVRCWMHRGAMKRLHAFFQQTPLLRQVAEGFPFVYEQPTRAFFYYRSTFSERMQLLEDHMLFLQEKMKPEAMLALYSDRELRLWQMDMEDTELRLILKAAPGQRKEGCMALMLMLGAKELYQMMLWIAKNRAGEESLYIGAMQGPNMDDARDVIKRVTKKCHAYRTKNLILYMTQAVARTLGLKHIYAVTNEGYYANNHMRRDRKLKTSFSDFWMEAGGWHTEDSRFDELPLVEKRKTMEEISTHKRAVYRRRFALLDEVDAVIAEHVKKLMK